MKKNIELLSKHNIDSKKWNICIEQNNGLIYGLYEYLTIMTDDWHGIVVGDYECVLPIPWKQKLGIRYAPVVPFIQQLTLCGNYTSEEEEAILFLLERFVQYGDYNINVELPFANSSIRRRTNFFLELKFPYKTIRTNYKENLRRNIQKAESADLLFERCGIQYALDAYAKNYYKKNPIIGTVYYQRFRQLSRLLETQNNVLAYAVRKEDTLLATALFGQFKNRLYNLLPCTLPEGKQCAAMHFLLDRVIQQYAETGMVFDFEGSDLPGVKAFYEQFSPIKQEYFQLHFNRLPFPLNKFKR